MGSWWQQFDELTAEEFYTPIARYYDDGPVLQFDWRSGQENLYMYKKNGEALLAKKELLKAEALNPGNTDIANLLNEVNQLE